MNSTPKEAADQLADQWREKLRDADVAPYLGESLVLYLAYGIPPGSFMRAVLSNDLNGAVSRADESSAHRLVRLVQWLRQHAPAVAWGSSGLVDEWITERQAQVKAS